MFSHHDNLAEQQIKLEKEFKEFMIKFDAAKRDFENYLIDHQINLSELNERLSQKDHFSESEWEFIQEKRKEFEMMNELLDQQSTPPQKTKPVEIQPNWIFCR